MQQVGSKGPVPIGRGVDRRVWISDLLRTCDYRLALAA